MTARISGVLIDGFGEPIANAQMRAVSRETGESIVGSTAYTKTGVDGSYDFTLEIGSYSFGIWFGSLGYQYVGDIYVSEGTPDCALDDILSIPPSMQPMVLTKVLQAAVDAQKAADSAAEDVRKNLIPLGKQYMTLAEAQADIANIPVDSTVYYRSPDDSALAIEVINNAGTLEPTGRKMPSMDSIQTVVDAAFREAEAGIDLARSARSASNVLYVDGRTRDLDPSISGYTTAIDYIRQYGSPVSYSQTHGSDTVFVLESMSLAGAARLSNLKITDSKGSAVNVGLLEGESTSGPLKTSPYEEFVLDATDVRVISVDTTSGFSLVKVAAEISENLPADTTRMVRDRSGRFGAYTSGTVWGASAEGVAYSVEDGDLTFKIANSAVTGKGYTLDGDGVKSYVEKELSGYILSRLTSVSTSTPFCNVFRVAAGPVTAVSEGVSESDKTVMCVGTFYCRSVSALTKTLPQLTTALVSSDLSSAKNVREVDRVRDLDPDNGGFNVNIANISTVANPLSLAINTVASTRFVLDKFSPTNVARRTVLRMTDGLGVAQELTFLEGEYSLGSMLYSPYKDFAFYPRKFNNIAVDTTTNYVSMDIDVTLPGTLPADTTRIIRDRAGVWAPYTPVTVKSGKGITYNSSTGRLTINMPSSDITAAGYDLTQKGIISYVIDNLSGYRFSQLTGAVESRPFCNVFALSQGAVVIVTDGAVASDKVVTAAGRLMSKRSGSGDNGMYKRLVSKVFNNLDIATGLRPVRLKCKFSPGEVASEECLVVKDSSGTVYQSQWAEESDFNPRRGATLGYWADGSLRCGSLMIFDNLPANSSKEYIVEAHPAPQVKNVFSRCVRETQTSLLVTADDGTQARFDSVVGWLLYKLTRDNKTYTAVCQHLLITRVSGSAATYSCGYADAAYRIISDGPLFTEIESTFKNSVQASYPTVDKQYLGMKYRTRVYKNGHIEVDAQHRLLVDLPDNILYGSECRIQMDSSETKTIRAGYNSIWSDNSVRRSISLRYANGDVRRDDGEINTLASRPSVINVNTTSTYTRADVGWAQFGSSILGAPQNWAWTMGFSINMNEPEADNNNLSDIMHNPPAGFASSVSLYPRIRKSAVMGRLAEIISGIVDWSEHDASSVDTADGKFNTLAGSLVRHLHSGLGSFDAEYAKFDAWATGMYGGIGNIHMGSAAEYKGLQFASRLVLPHLHWFYKVAQKRGDTAKMDALKVAIANMALDCHNAFGGIGKANSNFYAASFRAWGLAVMAGLDPNGTYAADMDMVDGQFSSRTYFEGATNIITDNPLENVGGMRYLHYQMYAYNNYLLGCEAAGRPSVIDMKTYIINSMSAYGGVRDIDYCVAESRRGNPTTVAFMLYPLVHSGDVSCVDAACKLLDAFEEYAGSNTSGRIKLWDLNYLSTITTSFSEYTFACNIMADTWMRHWKDNS